MTGKEIKRVKGKRKRRSPQRRAGMKRKEKDWKGTKGEERTEKKRRKRIEGMGKTRKEEER